MISRAAGNSWRVLTGSWIALILIGSALYINEDKKEILKLAEAEANVSFSKDITYRLWAAEHGGVYVPETDQTPPNPYLAHIPERDIVTLGGKRLTLMNPAYMMRQVHEMARSRFGSQAHITSLRTLNPNNAPDQWEQHVLEEFDKTPATISSQESINGVEFLRVMFPLAVEKSCLKCHEHQGYKVGDNRGGISVSVPMEPYNEILKGEVISFLYVMVAILLMGLAGIYFANRQILRHLQAFSEARDRSLRSERKYRAMFEEAPYGIGIADTETGIMLDCNLALARMVEREPGDVIGRSQKSLHPVQDSDEPVTNNYSKHRGTHTGKTLTDELITSQGEIKKVEVKANIVVLDEANLLQGFFQDVTEETKARAIARKKDEQLIAMFSAAQNVGFVIADSSEEARVVEFSPGAEAIFGYLSAEIVGQPVGLLHDSAESGHFSIMQERMARGEIGFRGEINLKRKSGEHFPALFTLYPMLDQDGELYGGLGVTIDITEQKRLEGQLRQSHKMEAIGTLAGGIAHDFNNILGAIMGYTELTLDLMPEGSESRENLDKVLSASKRAKELVQQILTFSRKGEENREPVQIQFVVEEVVKLLRKTIPANIDVAFSADPDTGQVLADATQMHQVIMNLCTNSYHSMNEAGGELRVTVGPITATPEMVAMHPGMYEGPYVHLRVEDTGQGIAPEDLPRVFDPFFTTKSPGEGTGMGLSVVHGIVRSHGGVTGIESESGKGTKIEVFLPRVELQAVTAAARETLSTGNESILFVDDEPLLAELGERTLESLGYRVTAMTSPEKALEVFRRDPEAFDLLVTDQTMAGMTGNVLAKEAMRIRPGFPVIICTGFSDILKKEDVLAMGVRALLMKPIERDKLSEELRQVFDESL